MIVEMNGYRSVTIRANDGEEIEAPVLDSCVESTTWAITWPYDFDAKKWHPSQFVVTHVQSGLRAFGPVDRFREAEDAALLLATVFDGIDPAHESNKELGAFVVGLIGRGQLSYMDACEINNDYLAGKLPTGAKHEA